MAYDQVLAGRIRGALGDLPGLEEKAMFGGVGFLLQGNMACGVHKDGLMVRVGPDGYEAALGKPDVRVFDMTGRPMKGWVVVGPAGCAAEDDLRRWVQEGVTYARSLAPK